MINDDVEKGLEQVVDEKEEAEEFAVNDEDEKELTVAWGQHFDKKANVHPNTGHPHTSTKRG